MIQTSKIKRVKIILLSLLALVLAMSFALSNNKTEGASSATVGHKAEDSEGQQPAQQQKKPAKVSPQSAGCVVCHTGSESMHMGGDDGRHYRLAGEIDARGTCGCRDFAAGAHG